MNFPLINKASLLKEKDTRLYIGAYGFEERSLGWTKIQNRQGKIINEAIIFYYKPDKGINRVDELRTNLVKIGVSYPEDIPFNYFEGEKFDKNLEGIFRKINDFDEIVVDITAMTKFLILLCLCKLIHYKGTLRLVYSEAEHYSPSFSDYKEYKNDVKAVAYFPSQGFKKILRAKCLSSIRMQGQPVALIAFTSFNEQLFRHMLGTISPYRLIFINGKPPRKELAWREAATQSIHSKLIDDYRLDNEIDTDTGLLKITSSTLLYQETIQIISKIYSKYGNYERIIIAATGSKMQTVGLFFSKIMHSDLHIEYPTPDSYFFNGMSKGIDEVHEVVFSGFSDLIKSLL